MTIDFTGQSVVVTGAGRGLGRRYARAFVGLGPGWLADRATEVTAEDIADHLTAVTATEPFAVPLSVADELLTVLHQLNTL